MSPHHLTWTIEESVVPGRLDRLLVQHLQDVSRAYLMRFIEAGQVLVDGETAKKSVIVGPGQKVEIRNFLHPSEQELVPNHKIPVRVIGQTDDFYVIDKPAGIHSHAINYDQDSTLANILLARFPETKGVGDDPLRPGIVHRLDSDTSGLLIVARSQKAYKQFRQLFHDRAIYKEYAALVIGEFPYLSKTWTWPIAHHPNAIQKMIVTTNETQAERHKAKDAITHAYLEKRFEKYSLMRVVIETGRMHQIRVHLAHAGFPVAGDPIYRKGGDRARDTLAPKRQLLHAHRLRFTWKDEDYEFVSPLPADFQKAFAELQPAARRSTLSVRPNA